MSTLTPNVRAKRNEESISSIVSEIKKNYKGCKNNKIHKRLLLGFKKKKREKKGGKKQVHFCMLLLSNASAHAEVEMPPKIEIVV